MWSGDVLYIQWLHHLSNRPSGQVGFTIRDGRYLSFAYPIDYGSNFAPHKNAVHHRSLLKDTTTDVEATTGPQIINFWNGSLAYGSTLTVYDTLQYILTNCLQLNHIKIKTNKTFGIRDFEIYPFTSDLLTIKPIPTKLSEVVKDQVVLADKKVMDLLSTHLPDITKIMCLFDKYCSYLADYNKYSQKEL